MIRSLALAALSLGVAAPVLAADPQNGRTCAPRAEIVSLLTEQYREMPMGTGVSESGDAAFEMFRSTSGSWTITMTTTNGMTCVMAAGRDWQAGDEVALLPRS